MLLMWRQKNFTVLSKCDIQHNGNSAKPKYTVNESGNKYAE